MKRPAFVPDDFTLMLVATVALATLLPAQGGAARFFEGLTTFAIGLLFFLHGAKLSRDAIRAGVTHWRLHLLVFACTFVLFPVLGVALKPLLQPLVTPALYTGLLFLCVLPATVQSAIAFTSMARGNIPAAVCSASVIEGLWKQVPLLALAGLLVACAVLLGIALFLTGWFARRLGFDKADEITIVFCGSKKSLASGIPMAKVLFPAHVVGATVLPLMLFHQMQLMVCAVLAQRYARRVEDVPASKPA
jgi:predicted Na+-dependent transporter